MGIVFRSGTKPDNLQENAWDVHDKTKNIKEEGIKEAKYAEATIPYNKNNVLALVDAHQNLAPILDKYKNEARDLDGQNRKRIVDRQIKNSEVRRRNIKTRLDTDLRNLQSLQNIVTATWGIAQDVDKINKLNAEQRREDLASMADRSPYLSREDLTKHHTGTDILTAAEIKDFKIKEKAREGGLSELEIDKLLQPGGWYLRDAFTTDLAYKTADTFQGWVASIAELPPEELFGSAGSFLANSYAQAKANYASDASVTHASDLEAWQSAIENKFFEDHFKGKAIEGKFKLATSHLFLDTRERVGTEGRVGAQKNLKKNQALQTEVVHNVRIRNNMTVGRQRPDWKKGDDLDTKYERASDMVQAISWDFEKRTRNIDNGRSASENRTNYFRDLGRLGTKLQIPSTVINEWLDRKTDNGQTNRERWQKEINKSGLIPQLRTIEKLEAEQGAAIAEEQKKLILSKKATINTIFNDKTIPLEVKRREGLKIALTHPDVMKEYQKRATFGYNINGTDFNKEIQQRIKNGTFTVQWLHANGLYNEDIVRYYDGKLIDIQKIQPVTEQGQARWSQVFTNSERSPSKVRGLGVHIFKLHEKLKPEDHPTFSDFMLIANEKIHKYYEQSMTEGIKTADGRVLKGAELEIAAIDVAFTKLQNEVLESQTAKGGSFRLCPPEETGLGVSSMCEISSRKRTEGLERLTIGTSNLKTLTDANEGMTRYSNKTGDGSHFFQNEVLEDHFFEPRNFFTELEAYNKDPENNVMPQIPGVYFELQSQFGFNPLQMLLWQAGAYNKYQIKAGGDLIEFNVSMLPDPIKTVLSTLEDIPRQFLDPNSFVAMNIGRNMWNDKFTNPYGEEGQTYAYGIIPNTDGAKGYTFNPDRFSPRLIELWTKYPEEFQKYLNNLDLERINIYGGANPYKDPERYPGKYPALAGFDYIQGVPK